MDLQVSFLDQPCGTLSIEDERFTFHYSDDYIAAAKPPISVTMPVAHEIYADSVVFPFFENLLPKGVIRTLLAEGLKTSGNNFARLFEATGGEVAGALTISADVGIIRNKKSEKKIFHLHPQHWGKYSSVLRRHPFSLNGAQKCGSVWPAHNENCLSF